MTLHFSRRQAGSLLASLAAAPILGAPLVGSVRAQDRELNVRGGGNFKPIPIALTRFVGEGGEKVTSVLQNDLKRSVFLTPVGDTPTIANPDEAPVMDQFRAAGAQYVVTGRVSDAGSGLQTQFRMFDVNTSAQVAGEQYNTDANNVRRVAHIVADAVFTKATGEKGFFDTRVVFIDESGPATRPAQAPRHHGSGWRQRALSLARRRPRRHAALLADLAGYHLHGLRRSREPARACS